MPSAENGYGFINGMRWIMDTSKRVFVIDCRACNKFREVTLPHCVESPHEKSPITETEFKRLVSSFVADHEDCVDPHDPH